MTIDELVELAASRIRRYAPHRARDAAAAGAILIDIRATDARERHGVIPGSVHVPRTVLEWRVDRTSKWRNPALDGAPLILVCDHGYSSVLAAATLVDLGRDAGDLIGGFDAWVAAGLPVEHPVEQPGTAAGGLPGMGVPPASA